MKHWVFDLDGTLVDSLTIHFQILEKVFERYGVSFSKGDHQDVLKATAKTLPHYFQLRFGENNATEALKIFVELTNAAVGSIRPFDGIERLLKILKDQGIKLAVWTARDLDATTKILESSGLAPFFSICVTGTCTEQGKPHPEGLHRIAKYFNADAETMVMVGDFDSDMLGAQAFGCKGIRVLWHPLVEQKKCDIAHRQFNKVDQLSIWAQSQFV